MYTEQSVTQPERKWTEKDGVIRFTVTSDGTTGPEWIERLRKAGIKPNDFSEDLIRRMDTTEGLTTNVVVLKGELLLDFPYRTTYEAWKEASRRGLILASFETTCLIHEKFTKEELAEMGLRAIIAVHKTIDRSFEYPYLHRNFRYSSVHLLNYYKPAADSWSSDTGFAFVAPQTQISS